MYIFTITLTKAKISALTAVLLLFVMVCVYIIPTFLDFKTTSLNDKFLIKNTEKGRHDFISSLGYTADDKPYLEENFNIPQKFSETFESYNELQKSQGLDLEAFKGKTAKKFTYRITNFKDKTMTVYINLFIFDGRVIAGDINCPDLKNGFIKNFLNI